MQATAYRIYIHMQAGTVMTVSVDMKLKYMCASTTHVLALLLKIRQLERKHGAIVVHELPHVWSPQTPGLISLNVRVGD